MFVLRGL